MNKYSCIIPIYNEEPRIYNVLQAIVHIPELSEIICVDDGSTDNSAKVIKNNFPNIKLIQHNKNLGKTNAVISGLKLSKYNSIIILDSDLEDLKSIEISKAIRSFEQNQLDCLLLNTAPMNSLDQLLRKLFRFLLLTAGNRIIYKQCLLNSLTTKNLKSYHLEIAQNKYLMENKKKVAYLDVSFKDVSKISKEGLIKGLIDEFKMWLEMIAYDGLIFFLKQSLIFCKEKVY